MQMMPRMQSFLWIACVLLASHAARAQDVLDPPPRDASASTAAADDDDDDMNERKLVIDDLSFGLVSQYIWQGFELNHGDPAFQPSINFDLFQTGLSFNLWGSFGLKRGNQDANEVDYTLSYGRSLFSEESWQVDFGLKLVYFQYPHDTSDDTLEAGLSLSMPNLIPLGDGALVPGWSINYDWPSRSGGPERGWYQNFSLTYDVEFQAGGEEIPLSLMGLVGHTDGIFGVESGFSHIEFRVTSGFEIGDWAFAPFAAAQLSIEDTVNPDDEFWAGVTISYDFD